MRKYTHAEMHDAVFARCGDVVDPEAGQAYACPYWVPLTGVLGTDWGTVVSPDSTQFGRVIFEHDRCGCSPGSHETGNQRTDQWRDRKRERAEAGT